MSLARSVFLWPLQRFSVVWLTLSVVTLGLVLGFLLTSPLSNLAVSVIAILIYMAAIVSNPLAGLLLWLLTSPYAEKTINITLGASIPDLSPNRFCVLFLSMILLAQATIRKRKLLPSTGLDFAAILFLLGQGLSALEGKGGAQSIQGVFDLYGIPIAGYFLAKNLVKNRKDLDILLHTTLAIALGAAFYAFYEHSTGNILFAPEDVSLTIYKESGLRILRGLLQRSDHFGALFSMVIPLSFYLYLKEKSQARKPAYAIALGILLLGLFLTYKRTAWISFLVSALVLPFFIPRFRRFFIVMLLIFVLALGATWGSVSQSVVFTKRVQSEKSTTEGRTKGWEAAIDLWAKRPIFGYGFRMYEVVATRTGVEDEAIENEYIDILFSAGLIGFLPYLAMFILMTRNSIKLFLLKSRQKFIFVERDLVVVFWCIVLAYLVNYTSSRAGNGFVTLVFFTLVGAIVGSQSLALFETKPGHQSK